MSENNSFQLLPNGEFIFTAKDGQQHKGRFSMFVLNRFCEQKNVPNLLALFEKLLVDMKISDYADLILYALQDYFRSNVDTCEFKNVTQMMDALDLAGGLATESMTALIKHAIERVAPLKEQTETSLQLSAEELEMQKKRLNSNTDLTLSGSEGLSQA